MIKHSAIYWLVIIALVWAYQTEIEKLEAVIDAAPKICAAECAASKFGCLKGTDDD